MTEMFEHNVPTNLGAFHGDPKVKAFYLRRLEAHAAADELVKDMYWGNGKGCAIGCVIHGESHRRYATALNIPEELVHLQDRVFETLPLAVAKGFPVRFLSAIEPGADLTKVTKHLMVQMLADPDHGVTRLASTDRVREAIDTATALHARRLVGDEPTAHDWTTVRYTLLAAAERDFTLNITSYVLHVAYQSTYATSHADVPAATFSAAVNAAVLGKSPTAGEDYAALVADELVVLLSTVPPVSTRAGTADELR